MKVPQALTQLPPGSQPAPPSAVATRKLKLKELVDQISEEECDYLTETQIAACYARFETLMGEGERPPKAEDPTQEQLSAVAHLIKTGVNPYVDFGIFGPYGQRILKKVRLTGVKFNNNDELVRIEINGPANYGMWSACWNIYQNCLLMLDAVDMGKLLAYKKKMDHYFETHGDKIWALQYQTDVRTRGEHFVRLKRDALADYNRAWSECLARHGDQATARLHFKHAFDPDKPWDHVFQRALKDTEWWFQELGLPAIKNTANAEVEGDAPVHKGKQGLGKKTTIPPPDHSGNTSGQIAQRVKKVKTRAGRVHNVQNGHYTTSRQGIELCWAFNAGNCQNTIGQNKCPNHPTRLHLCSKCLQPRHNATECYVRGAIAAPAWVARSNNKGAGKGGKDSKPGKGARRGPY